jgi:hypothetical protein
VLLLGPAFFISTIPSLVTSVSTQIKNTEFDVDFESAKKISQKSDGKMEF